MLIKTPEFDSQLMRDIQIITINRNVPLILKGSYKRKPNGALLSDIDFTAKVNFSEKLLKEILPNIINKTKRGRRFYFIHLTCGTYDELNVPWIIDDEGCNFNLQLAHEWFENFRKLNLVPADIIDYIGKRLYGKELTMRDLVDIEKMLHLYASIKWKENDIRKGEITHPVSGKVYKLLDLMRYKSISVMKYMYFPKEDEFVSIDVGLVDRNYTEKGRSDSPMYYEDDCYKILKSFKWKVENKEKFAEVMQQVEILTALKYQVNGLNKIMKYKILPTSSTDRILSNLYTELEKQNIPYKGKNLIQIGLDIYDRINDFLCNYVKYFLLKIKPSEREKYVRFIERAVEAKVPVNKDLLIQREKAGLKCPFFQSDTEINPLFGVAMRTGMDPNRVLRCFSQASEEEKMSVDEVVRGVVGKNDMYLIDLGNELLLMDGSKERKFKPEDKKILQEYILKKNT